MRLLLGGGGTVEEEAPVLDRFGHWVAGGEVVYIPVAQRRSGRDWQACWDFAWGVLEPRGVKLRMWIDLAGRNLEGVAGVLIGGGNTFDLIDELRRTGFAEVLKGYDGTIYGGSAGAVVLGADVSTASHLDVDHLGLTDLAGLDLLDGRAVWVHHQPEDAVDAWAADAERSVIALPEDGGLCVVEGVLSPLGAGFREF